MPEERVTLHGGPFDGDEKILADGYREVLIAYLPPGAWDPPAETFRYRQALYRRTAPGRMDFVK